MVPTARRALGRSAAYRKWQARMHDLRAHAPGAAAAQRGHPLGRVPVRSRQSRRCVGAGRSAAADRGGRVPGGRTPRECRSDGAAADADAVRDGGRPVAGLRRPWRAGRLPAQPRPLVGRRRGPLSDAARAIAPRSLRLGSGPADRDPSRARSRPARSRLVLCRAGRSAARGPGVCRAGDRRRGCARCRLGLRGDDRSGKERDRAWPARARTHAHAITRRA